MSTGLAVVPRNNLFLILGDGTSGSEISGFYIEILITREKIASNGIRPEVRSH